MITIGEKVNVIGPKSGVYIMNTTVTAVHLMLPGQTLNTARHGNRILKRSLVIVEVEGHKNPVGAEMVYPVVGDDEVSQEQLADLELFR